ncbi:hypothetical protein CR513_59688, partial [Mucuna pruriens]
MDPLTSIKLDYFDTFVLIARISSIRILIALASIHNLVIHKMEVKIAFLNGDLEEEIYMTKLEGFDLKGTSEASVILGIRIIRKGNSILFTQGHHDEKLLRKFAFYDSQPVNTLYDANSHLIKNKGAPVAQSQYAQIIGSLLHLMNFSRPNVAYTVGCTCEIDEGIEYRGFPTVLEGYSDANWVFDSDETKCVTS